MRLVEAIFSSGDTAGQKTEPRRGMVRDAVLSELVSAPKSLINPV